MIMLPVDPSGRTGPKEDLPDKIVIQEPKAPKDDTPFEVQPAPIMPTQ